MKLVCLLFTAFICLSSLSGCEVAALASLAPNAGSLADMDSTDSHLSTLKLTTSTTGDAFVNDMKAVARKMGWRVSKMEGHGATARGVLLAKQSGDLASAFIGRDWQYAVSLNLEEDGRTIQIAATTRGNNHKADPGTAEKIVDEFQAELKELYASK